MYFLRLEYICCVALGLILIHGSGSARCRKITRLVTRDSQPLASYPVANTLKPESVYFNGSFGAAKPERYALCSVIVDTKQKTDGRKPRDVGIISQAYKSLVDYLSQKIQKVLDNRKHALSSTHPLRHQKWRIQLHRKIGFLGLRYRTEYIDIDFMEDGTLKTNRGHTGTWWSEYGNIVWKIYFDPAVDRATYFSAQFCWNNFGASAFMRRGVVYEDRSPNGWLPKYLFRPVIGKFSGEGLR